MYYKLLELYLHHDYSPSTAFMQRTFITAHC